MTDKEYAKQKKRVQKYIDKWFKTIGLGWFRVGFEWDRERDDKDSGTVARTYSQWQYKQATITWFLPAVALQPDDELEATVVHEFSHILLSGLAQQTDDDISTKQINEYTTELVANAIMWAREAK